MDHLVERARAFATEMHAGLVRPNRAKQPKIDHIAEVAALVTAAGGSPEAIAAAWLHDVVEDTPATLGEIQEQFGDMVGIYVDGLTDPDGIEAMPLVERKAFQADRIIQKPPEVRLVKLADQISNIRSVNDDPPLDWDAQTSWNYIQGAAKISRLCGGLSEFLDAEFEKAFEAGRAKYAPSVAILETTGNGWAGSRNDQPETQKP